MATINLRDYYPDYYTTDYIIDVPDEVKENMVPLHQEEAVYRRCMRRSNVCTYDVTTWRHKYYGCPHSPMKHWKLLNVRD